MSLLGYSAGYPEFAMAAPALLAGTVVWWALVERRRTHRYPFGVAFGVLTALFTVAFWVLVFTGVWGQNWS